MRPANTFVWIDINSSKQKLWAQLPQLYCVPQTDMRACGCSSQLVDPISDPAEPRNAWAVEEPHRHHLPPLPVHLGRLSRRCATCATIFALSLRVFSHDQWQFCQYAFSCQGERAGAARNFRVIARNMDTWCTICNEVSACGWLLHLQSLPFLLSVLNHHRALPFSCNTGD